jgi:hypothetical protein
VPLQRSGDGGERDVAGPAPLVVAPPGRGSFLRGALGGDGVGVLGLRHPDCQEAAVLLSARDDADGPRDPCHRLVLRHAGRRTQPAQARTAQRSRLCRSGQPAEGVVQGRQAGGGQGCSITALARQQRRPCRDEEERQRVPRRAVRTE